METFRDAMSKIDRSIPPPTGHGSYTLSSIRDGHSAARFKRRICTRFGVADPLGGFPGRMGLPENPLFFSTKMVLRKEKPQILIGRHRVRIYGVVG